MGDERHPPPCRRARVAGSVGASFITLLESMPKSLTRRQIRIVRSLAALVDVLQVFVFPVMFEGLLSPVNTAVDVVMAAVFTLMIGWHWALLPAFISELIPIWDLVPTWTAAVFLATRDHDVIDVTAVEVVSEEPKRLSHSDSADASSTARGNS